MEFDHLSPNECIDAKPLNWKGENKIETLEKKRFGYSLVAPTINSDDQSSLSSFSFGSDSIKLNCSVCNRGLTQENCKEKDGNIYCEQDFNIRFRQKCYACSKTILEGAVKAFQKHWHWDCFTCGKCSEPLCPFTFYEKDGKGYCEQDFFNLFAPKCYECREPIKDVTKMTRALGTTFHREHFTCFHCKEPLSPGSFRKKDDVYYCEEDYHKVFSPRCASCDDPIRHGGLMALGKKWHRDCCLRCGQCNKILKEDNYIEVLGKAYCRFDWLNLFAPKCGGCKGPVAEVLNGEGIIALGADWHPKCFTCRDCNCFLNENNYCELEGDAYCENHYHARTCQECLNVRVAEAERRFNSRPSSRLSSRSMSPLDIFHHRSRSNLS